MTLHRHISAFISRAAISALLAFGALSTSAQGLKPQTEYADTTRFFRGLQVMVDAVGPIQLAVSDYGQYEAALRINLKTSIFRSSSWAMVQPIMKTILLLTWFIKPPHHTVRWEWTSTS